MASQHEDKPGQDGVIASGGANVLVRPEVEEPIRKFDAAFEKWRETHPEGRFSEFSAQFVFGQLQKGSSHASLGGKLQTAEDWWKAGERPRDFVLENADITPESRICDYGCGSLRVGGHLMKLLNPGNYIGIDVSEDFISEGIKLVGADLIEQKKPVLGSIESRMDEVIAANVDVVFSFNVALHVHPDEQTAYNERLKAIAHKRGARLLLHMVESAEPIRFQKSGWAYPFAQYLEWMKPLVLQKDPVFVNETTKAGRSFKSYILVFDRL